GRFPAPRQPDDRTPPMRGDKRVSWYAVTWDTILKRGEHLLPGIFERKWLVMRAWRHRRAFQDVGLDKDGRQIKKEARRGAQGRRVDSCQATQDMGAIRLRITLI